MSSPLAIGAVSAVLRNLLDNGMVDVGVPVGGVKVSAVAPDTIKLDDANFAPQLNLFLYRVSENQGWRNAGLPSFDGNGVRRTSPPLALDLHYLLTAYGVSDFQAEILLGYAMHLLHERPVLDRQAIRTALDPSPLGASILPPEFQALSAADLAEQLEAVTVTPEPIDTEEMSRLWSAIQAHYRPTAGYLASVVLIEADRPTSTALPVLSRGRPDPVTGEEPGVAVSPQLVSPYPSIDGVEAPDPAEPAVVLGEVASLTGHHLDGTAITVSFAHRLAADPTLVAVADNADPAALAVKVPPDAPDPAADPQLWPAGLYTVTATMTRDLDGVTATSTTGVAAMLLAPTPQLPPDAVTRNADSSVTVQLTVAPPLHPTQKAVLTLGGVPANVTPIAAVSAALTFEFAALDAGPQWVRLSVDGVESRLLVRSTVPPRFDPAQRVTVP